MAALAFSNLAGCSESTRDQAHRFPFYFRHWDFSVAQLFALGTQVEYWHGALWLMHRRPFPTCEHTIEKGPRAEVSSSEQHVNDESKING